MNGELILRNVAKHIDLDAEEIIIFLSMLKWKQVKRKTLILNSGEVCKYISFVHSGVLRAFYLDNQGKQVTVMFAVNDWWITDMYCFLNYKPAMMHIEALTDSHILQLSKKNLDRLLRMVPKFEKFFRILMQNAYTREQLRVIERLSLSAEERYNRFLSKYPHIVKVVTQKQIASYLGVSPEHLSSLKKMKDLKIS